MPIRVGHHTCNDVTQLSIELEWVIAPEIPESRHVPRRIVVQIDPRQ